MHRRFKVLSRRYVKVAGAPTAAQFFSGSLRKEEKEVGSSGEKERPHGKDMRAEERRGDEKRLPECREVKARTGDKI